MIKSLCVESEQVSVLWNLPSVHSKYMMLCTIKYHLHNLKIVKNTHGGMLLLVKVQSETLLKGPRLNDCFSRFLNCINGTKSSKASHLIFSFPTRWASFRKDFSIVFSYLLVASSRSSLDQCFWQYHCSDCPKSRV